MNGSIQGVVSQNHVMQHISLKKILTIILVSITFCFCGCQSDCPVNCPKECVPISFVLLQDGINILEKDPISFDMGSMHVVSNPPNPEAQPLLGIDNESFKMVVCQDTEYNLYLNDSTTIDIMAKIDTFSVDNCCAYYSANSIQFNNEELCSNRDQCEGGMYELN